MKVDITPCLCSFPLGQEISLSVDVSCDCLLEMGVYKLDELVFEDGFQLVAGTTCLHIPAMSACGGYGVDCTFHGANDEVEAHTAFVVGPSPVVRYGFSCDFSPGHDVGTEIDAFLKMHIDTIQFYDWSYRHDDLVAPVPVYEDMMGKRNSLDVIRREIDMAHEKGMRALAYGAVYAACDDYWKSHPEQGLYDGAGRPITFIDVFRIMNVSDDGWTNHMIGQYSKAMGEVGFDGIHLDAYGWPKSALDSAGAPVRLEERLPSFIDECRKGMKSRCGKDPFLIFNNVGAWPVTRTMDSSVDVVYCEIWPPMTRYRDLSTLIALCRTSGKPVVMACYPKAFRLDEPDRALGCQLLLSFVIAMHGATQLFFGDGGAVLTQGYYPDDSRLEPWQYDLVRSYQDFLVRYQDLMADDGLEDVSMTHQDWDNPEYGLSCPSSADGEGGKVWCHVREDGRRKVVYLVNLIGNDDLWNEGKSEPPRIDIDLDVLVLKKVCKAWCASPEEGRASLHGRLGVGDKGLVYSCRIRLHRVVMVYIEEE